MTVAETFARWSSSLAPADVPKEVRHAAAQLLTDGVGCAVAAARLGDGAAAVEAAGQIAGAGEATIIGDGRHVAAPAAALANGTLVHALDFDDTHAESLVHTTAAVLPAAFAAGEERGASGAEVLSAAVAGYEVVVRLGAALPHGLHERGFHATSVCGVFSAALATARLLRLSERATTNALGIAGSMAGGLLEFLDTGSATKPLHPGIAGMNGILAARLAAAGAEGPATVFEGRYGLFASFLGARVDPAALTEGLGERWETRRVAIKPYPACQLSHASLDALASLRDRVEAPGEVDEIVFALPAGSIPIVCEPAPHKRRPRTAYEAKFSLPWCAAAMLVDRGVTLATFDGSQLRRPDLATLADRVTWTAEPFDGAPADAPGRVQVRLRSGGTLEAEAPARTAGSGDDASLLEKFHANCGGASDASRALAEELLAIESLPSLRVPLARTAVGPATAGGPA